MASNFTARAFDPDGADPLYQQVTRAIADDIAAGRLRPGDRLPSERALCQRLGISRVTARRALAELVEEGLVESSAGRGWFVAGGPVSEPPNKLLSFTAMGRSRGLEPSARVLSATVRPATIDEADALQMAPGADVFEIERLRLLDGVPVSVDVSRLPLARAPVLPVVDFTHESLYEVLQTRCGVVPSHADYTVQATGADERCAGLLDLPVGGPVLLADQRTYDQGDRPFELGRVVYRGDRYRFRARLARRP